VSAVTPTPTSYASSFDEQVATVLPRAARRCPGFARRLADAGVRPEDLRDVAALDRIPVLSKDDLVALQHADPPFAGMLAEDAAVRRVFQSPGPLYEPEIGTPDAWRWAPALRAAGFSADDIVLNCFSYHLSPAGAMFEEACRALGARVLPGGIGSMDLQARACADVGASAYVGLPSYLKALLEKAEELGLELAIDRAFVSAEPLPPSLRDWLSTRVPVVRQGYGTAETGNLGYESSRMDGLHVPADALVQICDLTTGRAIHDGGQGQVVVTLLREEYPLVRFGTGDLSAWAEPAEREPEPTPRMRGWLGRVGDAVKVRGMFLHPRQVTTVMEGLDEVDAFRFVIEREDHRDVLRCEVVPVVGHDPAEVVDAVSSAVRSALRFGVAVTVVDRVDSERGPIDDQRTWE
jgi:phenylacetate-CoA ligase